MAKTMVSGEDFPVKTNPLILFHLSSIGFSHKTSISIGFLKDFYRISGVFPGNDARNSSAGARPQRLWNFLVPRAA